VACCGYEPKELSKIRPDLKNRPPKTHFDMTIYQTRTFVRGPAGSFRFSIFIFKKQKLVAARSTTRESILGLFGPPSFGAMSHRPKNTHRHEFCFTGFAYVVTKEIYLSVVNKLRTYSEYTRVSSKNRGTGRTPKGVAGF
jgi:hypothetical protein